MVHKFNNMNDVHKYVVVRNIYSGETRLCELSDKTREEIFNEFKDDSEINQDEYKDFVLDYTNPGGGDEIVSMSYEIPEVKIY